MNNLFRLTKYLVVWLQVAFLVSLGGCNLGDSVRRMLQKLGTNALWSQYSLKGRKTKRSFLQLSLAKVVISKFDNIIWK